MKLIMTALVFVSATAFANEPAKTATATAPAAPAVTATATATAPAKAEKIDCKDKKNKDAKECMKTK